ncbi:helix-turn-helix domain-containing protein [Pseudonocardia sp. ICBG601]|uniref:helix-turn-helix domain-containing protein n=1 Tax=Pseudonocardia sp. ICBG601 TaxID=2846759 RepID=UPI001CF6EC61|nr:helix-turn-helix domain-containing protein [Pseudonocardia sp. ICBG601]
MTAQIPKRRTKTGRELAKQFGVSRATVVKMMAEPREEFLARARERRAAVINLKLRGLTCAEIADQTGYSRGAVCRLLFDARRNGEWAAAVEHHRGGHAQ